MKSSKTFSIAIGVIITLCYMAYKQYQNDRAKTELTLYYNQRRDSLAKIEKQMQTIHESLQPQKPTFHLTSRPTNVDSIIAEINKEKKKHHIAIASFDKQDSCIIIFRDFSPVEDTFKLNEEFSDLCYKYKIDVASNITSMIVFKMPLPSQKNDPDFDYQVLFVSAKTGSKIYNSYDSMGMFKH